MRRYIIIIFAAFLSLSVIAQNVLEELQEDPMKAGSNYYHYPTPTSALTPAPKGKKPFYISHYGRHGSRYLNNQREYDYPYTTLLRADSLGKLSVTGKEMLRRVTLLREEANLRLGELTPLGIQQHKEIARRMYSRFPEVFKGDAEVKARSTVVIRCILSMENALLELKACNPRLRINHDASQRDMYYMNQQDYHLFGMRQKKEVQDVFKAYCNKHSVHQTAMDRLFNDTVYAHHEVDEYELNRILFKLASSVQGTELGKQFSLFDIYTKEELYHNWLQANAYWYIMAGICPQTGGKSPFTQRNLLRKIIEEADSAIARKGSRADLRFGHETVVLPLTCLLDINHFGSKHEELEQLESQGWINYKVYPMACNIQIVFYRKNEKDQDVLLKVLLNENEATLPLPTDCAPYSHWSDFRTFYLEKLSTYKE